MRRIAAGRDPRGLNQAGYCTTKVVVPLPVGPPPPGVATAFTVYVPTVARRRWMLAVAEPPASVVRFRESVPAFGFVTVTATLAPASGCPPLVTSVVMVT
jgi:hypothetical protein